MQSKGTRSADTVWIHKSDGLEFDSGNTVRLMFHYSIMTEHETRIKSRF